jgi:hypothetical protein
MKSRTVRALLATAVVLLAFGFLILRASRSERDTPKAEGAGGADAGAGEGGVDGSVSDAGALGHRLGATGSPPCEIDAGVTDSGAVIDAGVVEGGILCSNVCKNGQTDNNNCGTCGTVCPCGASWNYCENCTSGVCCIAKGSLCQFATGAGGSCCDGSTCSMSPTGYALCQ